MKDSLLKDALVDYLKVEYTIDESIDQLNKATIKIINIVEITYENGVKEQVIKDENGIFVKYKEV